MHKHLEYADLLSGDAIFIEKVGHFRSPFLYELKPSGIGELNYKLFLRVFAWNKEEIIQYLKILGLRGLKPLEQQSELNCYDILTLLEPTRDLLCKALDFFMVDNLKWDKTKRHIEVFNENQLIGIINRNNFELVKDIVLQLNYVGLSKNKNVSKVADTAKTKARWEQAQKFLEQGIKKPETNSEDTKGYDIGNIISKLCATHNSYNLLNVYNLTVFQLYDQFFQVFYLRSVDLQERIFSIHGSKDFKMENWIKPLNKGD